MAAGKTRTTRSSAPTPSPAPGARASTRSTRSRSTRTGKSDETGLAVVPSVVEEVDEGGGAEEEEADGDEVDKGDEHAVKEGQVDEADDDGETGESLAKATGQVTGEAEDTAGEDQAVNETGDEGDEEPIAESSGKEKVSMEERMAKLKDLRMRMNQSTAANRRDLVSDHQKQKVTAKELQRLEKQKKLAQTLRLKAEAEASGEDMERRKAWEWSIEQNERWEEKQAESKIKSDSHFHNAEDDAWKRYNRNIRSTKADLLSYEKQKEAALGLAPGTLVPVGSTSRSLQAGGSRAGALSAAEDLYRGADTLAYGDSKPSEDAVDRVIGKINKDMDKGKRKKKVEEEGEINYINDRNKVFNKKVARYFDKYTKEIRANFERGTAL